MTEEQVKTKLAEKHLTWEQFEKFMIGQTVGMNKDGSANFYEYDVEHFLRNKGKMNSVEWD